MDHTAILPDLFKLQTGDRRKNELRYYPLTHQEDVNLKSQTNIWHFLFCYGFNDKIYNREPPYKPKKGLN